MLMLVCAALSYQVSLLAGNAVTSSCEAVLWWPALCFRQLYGASLTSTTNITCVWAAGFSTSEMTPCTSLADSPNLQAWSPTTEWDNLIKMAATQPHSQKLSAQWGNDLRLGSATPAKPIPGIGSTPMKGMLGSPAPDTIASLHGPVSSPFACPKGEGPATPTQMLNSGIVLSGSDSYDSPGSSFGQSTSPLTHALQVGGHVCAVDPAVMCMPK